MNSNEWSKQSKEAFELENVGKLWEAIHTHKLEEVEYIDVSENEYPLQIVFKFKKIE